MTEARGRQAADQEREMHNALQVTTCVLGVASAITLSFFALAIYAGTWQLAAWGVGGASITLTSLVGIWWIRRGRPAIALWSIVGMSAVASIAANLWIGDLGWLFGLICTVALPLFAIQALPARQSGLVVAVCLAAGLGALILDTFGPADRMTLPAAAQPAIWLVGIAALVVPGFVTVRRFASYALHTKLILILLVVALTPVGLVASFNDRAARVQLTQGANEALLAAASQTATNLDAFVNGNLDNIRVEAQLPLWSKYLTLVSEQRSDNSVEAEVRAALRALSRKTGVSSYALIDLQGRAVMDTFASYIGADKSDRGYFQEPVRSGLPYVSPVEFSPLTGKPSLYFSGPVRNSAGRVVGVLRVRYDAAVLQTLVAQSSGLAGSGSFAILFDEHQIRLAHGIAPEMVLRAVVPPDPALLAQLQAARRLPPLQVEELSTDLPDLEQKLSQAAAQPFFTAQDTATGNTLNQVAVTKMKTRPWLVAFFQPQEVFLAPAKTQTRSTLLIAILAAGVVTIAAVGLGQFLARPIVHLTATAGKVAAGDLDLRAPVETRDEIGQLAMAFNNMTARLQETIVALQQRIHEREQAEAALRESEATTRALLEAVPDAIFQLDREGAFLRFQPAEGFETITPPSQFIGKRLDQVLPPSLAHQTRQATEQALQTGKTQSFEYTLTLDGKETHYEARLTACGEGQVLALVRDITERRQAEQDLRIKDNAIASSISAIALADLEGRLTYTNRAFLELWGYDDDREILGRPAIEFWQEQEEAAQVEQAIVDRGNWVGEMIAKRKDGSALHLQLSASTVSGVGGEPICMMASFQDISAWVQAEAEVRKLNRELERRVIERTAQFEEANRELESFAYTVSHDLRAPLRAMNGFAHILISEYAPELPAEAQRYLHMIEDNAQQMGQLIDDLLTFSRLGRLALQRQLVAPADLVHQALKELHLEREGRQVEITIGDLPPCYADPELLKQVYVNLMSNAYKFTRTREVARIEVGCEQGDGEPVYYVRDNGVGFDMRYADKLFVAFQRLHSGGEYEGTGVGLAIVQRIMQRHGGRVWAEAEVDRGAAFYFTFEKGKEP